MFLREEETVTLKSKPKSSASARNAKAAAKSGTARSTKATKLAASSKKEAADRIKAAPESTKEPELRSILEDLRKRTLREIAEKVRSGTAATSQEIGDLYDLASEERDRELDLLLGDRERGKLHQIDEAFTRLEEGTYGQCEECGEPINPKRLRVVPFARTCVDCQTDKETEERMQRDRELETEKVYVATPGVETPLDEDEV